MTDLYKLKVSLTKHGAHKIATILKHYPADEILQHLSGSIAGVNIEKVQAKKNLSVKGDVVPEVWTEAKAAGTEYINALTFVAIVFSHWQLIAAMQSGSKGNGAGTITREVQLSGKAYTNFACVIEELGFSTSHTKNYISYDLSQIFLLSGFSFLAQRILWEKLISAGWGEGNPLEEELINIGANKVFALTEENFHKWLSVGEHTIGLEGVCNYDSGQFEFSPGHANKSEGQVSVSRQSAMIEASTLHNQIQNGLYKLLVSDYGFENVGTEQPTGYGTFIDVVLKKDERFIFFEIKTSPSVKVCIREALSQLMEYAYWPDKNNAAQLVIVSQNELTPDAIKYIDHIKGKFGIPIRYQQFEVR